jgi:hypothetical protein
MMSWWVSGEPRVEGPETMNPLIRKLERFTRLSDADKRLLQKLAPVARQ